MDLILNVLKVTNFQLIRKFAFQLIRKIILFYFKNKIIKNIKMERRVKNKIDFYNLITSYLEVEYPFCEFNIDAKANDIYNYQEFYEKVINVLIHF